MKNIDEEKNIKWGDIPPPLRIELNSGDDNNQFAENIINTVHEPLIVLDHDLKVVTASRSFYNFFKVNIDETIGKHIYDLGNQQWNIPKLRELLETILPQKTTFDNYEVEHEFSTIGKRIMLLNARQIVRAFGKEKIILLAIVDITERKHKEEALSEKNRMTSKYLDILLDHARAPIIIWNSSLVIKRFNREFEKLSGYHWTEVYDKKIEMLFPKDKIDSTLELIKNTLNVKNVDVIEIDILTKDKDIRTVLWNSAIIFDEEGINTAATIAQDITKLKNAESELRMLSRVIEQSPVSVVITNPYGDIEYVNINFCVITGYSKEEVMGKNQRIFKSHYHDNKFYEELWNTILSGKEWKGEILNKKKNGDLYWESELIFSLVNNNGDMTQFIAIKEDITEQKQIRSELLISEERYKAIFNTSLELVYIFDLEGQILEANTHALNLFGYTLEESKRLKLSDILEPGDLLTATKNIEYVIANGVNQGPQEYRLRTKKGGEIYIETTGVRLDKDGKPYSIMGIARNITERKHTEKKMIEAKEKAEEMNRLKTNFLANMSHELRTPLIGILGYAEFLENELTDKELQKMAKTIKSSGERLHKTLNNILDISRIETEKQQVNIKEHDLIKYLIEQVELFRAAAEGKSLSLNFETKEEILNAYIDEEMFVSIINNLLENAIKYTNAGNVTLIAKREKDNAVIEIIDTGIGVHEDLYNLIFEPFRQASEGYGRSHQGTGLGLTLVKKYTDLMHGTIVLNSKSEGGSTFILKLPLQNNITEVLINTNWV